MTLVASAAYAAPIPGAATSALTSPSQGLFFSSKGFRLGTEGTDWLLQQSKQDNTWRFKSAKSNSAAVSLKTDYLKADLTLESYAKRWMRDYSQLGLDVLGTRTFAVGNNRGLVIDVLQPKKKIQMRQAVFLKNKSVVIVTCSDEQGKSDALIGECNRLIKNFSWVEGQTPTQKR